MLSTPCEGSQFGVKKRLPFTTTGEAALSVKSIAWKLPLKPLMVRDAQQAPNQLTETLLFEATVTIAVAVPKVGVLAVIVAWPADTPVTGTPTSAEPAAKVTVEGTVAIAVLLEFRVTGRPAEAPAERNSVRFCAEPTLIVRPVTGVK
jgi:hypothetical protein